MNNIPENENLNDSVTENSAESVQDDFSTVFSTPAAHKKSSDNVKKKKLLPIILSSMLAVAILIGGTVAVIKLIPEKEEDDNTAPSIEEIEVLSLKSDDFKTVTVNNSNGAFKLYSVKKESDSSSSDTSASVSWRMEGYNEDIIDSMSLSNIADSVAVISASREVTEKSAADCGLDKPTVTATVITEEDKEFSVLLGSESPDKSGYYLKLSDSDKIYVVGEDLKANLDFTAVSLANTDSLPAFPLENAASDYKSDDGTLASFDKLTITGKNFSEPLIIVPNDADDISTLAAYKVISPTKRIAENMDGIFDAFKSGITVSGAYALDTTPKTLAELKLNSPDFTAVMQIGKQSHTFKFSLQPDGSYAAVCDGSKIVKKVSAEAIPFIESKTTDFYSEWICLNSIDNLKEFTFKVDGTAHTFGITANPDEDSDEKYIIKYNGETLKSSPFQNFYQDCISIMCADFTVDKVSASPRYTIIFTNKDDIGGKQIVEFSKYSETKYQCTVDGVAIGKVTASALKNLENSLQNLLNK